MCACTESRTGIEDYLDRIFFELGIALFPRRTDDDTVREPEFLIVFLPVVCPVFIVDITETVKASADIKELAYLGMSVESSTY